MTKPSDLERRKNVSFDAFHFDKELSKGHGYNMKQAFQHICNINLWGSAESVSGEGSSLHGTKHFRDKLIALFEKLQIRTLLDAPCGDRNWISSTSLPLDKYIGIDILEHLIDKHQQNNSNSQQFEFICANIAKDPLPKVDLILCRDCLVHFSYADIEKTLQNFKQSGSRYLLMSTFTEGKENEDIITGDWRPLNFELPPFTFPKPITVINENCDQNKNLYDDKSLSLWEIN